MKEASGASRPLSPDRNMSWAKMWFMAIRPRTLALSLTPVVVGTALAWAEAGQVNMLAAVVAALGAMFIQIGANLYNDAADFERGGDGPNRLGPSRVTAGGLMTASQVKRGAFISFGVTALLGCYLISIGGWPILLLGVASIFCGWAYTGGPLPIAYTPIAELFVVLFFGVGAVGGTVWLHTGALPGIVILVGVIMGLFAAAVNFVNNYRDCEQDRENGRRTLAMLVGPEGGRMLYMAMLLLPFLLIIIVMEHFGDRHCWLVFGSFPMVLHMMQRFAHEKRENFNPLLGGTARIQVAYGLLLSIGLLW